MVQYAVSKEKHSYTEYSFQSAWSPQMVVFQLDHMFDEAK